MSDIVAVNPSTVKNEGKVREAPQEVSKFEAFQEEDEMQEITEVGGGIDLATRVLETLHSDLAMPHKDTVHDNSEQFLGRLEPEIINIQGSSESGGERTSTSNLSPVDLNERFNKAEGVMSVFTPSPDANYETVNPPISEEQDMSGPFSNILHTRTCEPEGDQEQ